MVALIPLVAQPFLSISVEAFDNIEVGAAAGSLVGVLALVAVPVLVLGAVAPWAIRLRVTSTDDAGKTAGRLYALSTLGSLFGTFAASLLLIPLIGTQRTFIFFALLLAVTAALSLPVRFALVPAVIAAMLALPPGVTKDLAREDGRILVERETEYQYARVVERPDGERRLELNEGQAFHSVYRPDTVLTGNVWDGYISLPFAALDRPPRSVAILGNGAGTTVRAYARYFPETAIDGVEIDPELTELGREYFGLEDRPGLRLIHEDARPFLRGTDRRYDAIFVDAYRQPYIPFYLTTEEFFDLVRRAPEPGRHGDRQRRPPGGLARAREGAGRGRALGVRAPRRLRHHRDLDAADRRATGRRPARACCAQMETVHPEVRSLFARTARGLRPPIVGEKAFTDDRAPVEWLIDRSLVCYAADAD